jgi:hypothetical protein
MEEIRERLLVSSIFFQLKINLNILKKIRVVIKILGVGDF